MVLAGHALPGERALVPGMRELSCSGLATTLS